MIKKTRHLSCRRELAAKLEDVYDYEVTLVFTDEPDDDAVADLSARLVVMTEVFDEGSPRRLGHDLLLAIIAIKGAMNSVTPVTFDAEKKEIPDSRKVVKEFQQHMQDMDRTLLKYTVDDNLQTYAREVNDRAGLQLRALLDVWKGSFSVG